MYIGQKMMLLKKAHQREQYIKNMQEILDTAKKENRAFSAEENTKFENLEKQVKSIDDELEKHNTSLEDLMEQMNERDRKIEAINNPNGAKKKVVVKERSANPLEVRGYIGKERIGKHDTDITIGDLVVAYVTGKHRNEEVKRALSTTGSGILVPTEVYSNFIDMMREQNFLLNVTTYPMQTKALTIPKVVGDVLPTFKAENDLILESNPLFDGVTLEAKPLYAMTSISLELLESSAVDLGMAVTQIMSSAMAQAVQSFMLKGGGSLGYEGILNDVGINKIDATDVNYASIGAGIRAIRNNRGIPNGLILNSADSMDMNLLTDTTGQFIVPPKFMEQLNQYEMTGALDVGEAVVLDFNSIAWGVLSEGGLQIDIDKQGEAFSRGQIRIRARINSDFALTNPKLVSHVRPTAI
jgi:HK97 family phage major capsid protein